MQSHTKYIEEIANQVLEKAGCKNAPVSVESVAKAVKLEVIEFPFHDKISGLLKKEQGVIGVNKTHHPLRKRFTIAHELGHFLLGHGLGEYQEEETIDSTFDKSRPEEREANQFASNLLMPKDWVKKHVEKNGMDIETMAKAFGVSKQAATIRLLELKLI